MQNLKRKCTASYQDKVVKQLESIPDRTLAWSKFDDDMIRKYYPTKGSLIAEVLGKSRNAVQKRASILGVKIKRGDGN